MPDQVDSPYVLVRWREVSGETEKLLRKNEELLERRVALCRRRADLFRELLNVTRSFVDDVASSSIAKEKRQPAGTSTGTVESSALRR